MGFFFDYAATLYRAACAERPVVKVPQELATIVADVLRLLHWQTEVEPYALQAQSFAVPQSNKIAVGLSGGLDSAYILHSLQDSGHVCTAVHVDGLNRSAAKEEAEKARKIASLAGAKFVRVKFATPQQAFPDNPFKNQLVLGMMLDIGLERGIAEYSLGSDWSTPLADSAVGYTLTDSIEVNRAFWAGVQMYFPQARLVFIPDNVKKLQRIEYLCKNHIETMRQVTSCVAPLRFREHLHKTNRSAFGDVVWDGRCGSCYKCAMEYILMVLAGVERRDEGYMAHCWQVLATSKNSHRPELFSPKLTEEERVRNILNYGS